MGKRKKNHHKEDENKKVEIKGFYMPLSKNKSNKKLIKSGEDVVTGVAKKHRSSWNSVDFEREDFFTVFVPSL